MNRFSDQFPIDLPTLFSSLSIWVFFCVTQFLLRRRNGNYNSDLQVISVCMNCRVSPIESGFRDGGGSFTNTVGTTVDYGNDCLFLRSLPFQWKWSWMLLSNQCLLQAFWFSRPFFSIRWVFDPGIDMEDLKSRMSIDQTLELWADRFMEMKDYEIHIITNKAFDRSIHDLTIEGYMQVTAKVLPWTPHNKCHEEIAIMVARFWNPKVWVFGGKIDDPKEFKEELKEIEASCNSDIECLVSDYGNSELMTEALGFVLRCANRSFTEEKLTKHKFRNKERSITKNKIMDLTIY
ncbi:hypothetical protein ISN45_Aa07g036180 [Arabidopsis thaliana x Arabidopsis arenosa]|uniref:Uncharacterized protein n=1 Tax=Arabidopsis thaliana x Arabidopsis arenosa TaxID=1240361 RepID=A0A8T1YCS5_9BRAS|nr:hypothetical protein ISN45_Aa07g036180 [Arabidopsis thaliana x Arabidopsis arenosa]